MIDASVAFILVLVLAQLSLVWLNVFVDSTASFHDTTEQQKLLILASDELINSPGCLGMIDKHSKRVLPQTINKTRVGKELSGTCHKNYGLDVNHEGIVVKRLVFLNKEGEDYAVLEVW